MYGLVQAGSIAHVDLVKHLNLLDISCQNKHQTCGSIKQNQLHLLL